MKLSVITINYNNASGLRKTMESVFAQTYKDFEYIVVDGASTDGSLDVIRDLVAPDFKDKLRTVVVGVDVVVSSEPDTGIYNAMNKGIRAAKGEYLLFLNSGDYLVEKDVIAGVFDREPKADILCARCNVSDAGVVTWTSNPPKNVTLGTLYFGGLAHQSTFIRRELFDRFGLYREDFRYNSDIEFWYRSIIFGGATTERINVVTTDYNLDGISSKENQNEQYKKEIAEILSHPFLLKCLPDYDSWKKEHSIVNEYKWINSHSFLRALLKIDYKIRKRLKCL